MSEEHTKLEKNSGNNAENNAEKKDGKTVTLAEVEEMAAQQGWDPEKGDLSALGFLGKGREFRDRMYKDIKELRQENQKVYGVIAEHITKQDKKDHEVEQNDIDAQIKAAVEAGDADKVLTLSKKVKEQPKEDPNIIQINNWISENKWFDENPDMKADALGFYQSETAKLGRDDPSIILPKIKSRIEKEYPDKFTASNPNKDRESGADKDGKKRTQGKKGLSRSDLTDDESMHFDAFLASGMSEEKLLLSIERSRHE